jgi:hypothetical protein
VNDIKEAADTIAKTTLVHIGDYTGHSDHDDLMSASPFYRLAYEAEMNDQGFFEHWYEGAVDRTADRIFRISQGDYEEASDLAFEVFEATIPAALPRVPRVLPAQTITKTTIAAEGPVVNGATNVAKHAQYVRMLELGQSASQKATRVRVLPDGRTRRGIRAEPHV